ncbi:MAG: hypothetical protein ABI832_05615 [bacterium]
MENELTQRRESLAQLEAKLMRLQTRLNSALSGTNPRAEASQASLDRIWQLEDAHNECLLAEFVTDEKA